MNELTMPEPLFFKIASGATTTFINARHVARVEIEAAQLRNGTLYLDDGASIEFGANEADWIMRLMSFHFHQQMKVVSEMKKLAGEK